MSPNNKTMKTKGIGLEELSMAFKLESGEILFITKEAIEKIANELIIEMMINKQTAIYSLKNNNIAKCNLLYKIIIEQKGKMSKKLLDEYLTTMLELLKSDDDTELTTLKEEIDKQQ